MKEVLNMNLQACEPNFSKIWTSSSKGEFKLFSLYVITKMSGDSASEEITPISAVKIGYKSHLLMVLLNGTHKGYTQQKGTYITN